MSRNLLPTRRGRAGDDRTRSGKRQWAVVWLSLSCALAVSMPLHAQDVASEPSRSAEDARMLDAVLSRPVTVAIDNVPLTRALKALATSAGVSVQYNAEIIEQYTKPVTLHARAISLGAALETVLAGTKLKVVPLSTSSFAVVPSAVTSAALVGTLAGTVWDGKTKQPLAGVTVMLDDSVARAQTDRIGHYRFANVAPGAHRLTVRMVGFARQTRLVTAVDNQSTVADFTLTASVNTLTEIVTTATGQKQRMEVGNDIGTIRADSLVATQQIRNVSDLLQGRLPGVFVANSDGAVGAPSRIRLRGANSISLNNDPIVIVDGIRINAQTTQAPLQTNTGSVQMLTQVSGPPGVNMTPQAPLAPSRLDDIDPNTIEKVEVLYGPSASSLYGTDAANGVIVITTKRGRPGSLRATLTADAGQSFVPGGAPQMWWGWGHFSSQAGPGYTASCNLAVSANIGGVVANGTCVQDSVTQYNPQNDPNMRSLGTGTSQSVNGTLSGGTDQVQQFLSASVQSDVGMAQLAPAQERVLSRLYNESLPYWMKRPNTQQEVNGLSRTTVTLGSVTDLSLSATGTYRNVLNDGNGLQSLSTNYQITGAQPGDTLTYLPAEGQRMRNTSVAKRGVLGADASTRPWSWLRLTGQAGGDYTFRTDEGLLRQQDCSAALQTFDLGYNAGGCPSLHTYANTETFVTTVNGAAAATYVPFRWLTLTTTTGEQYSHTTTNVLQVGNADPFGCPLAFGTQLLSPSPVCSNSSAQQYAVNNGDDASATAGVYLEETIDLMGFYYTLGLRRDVASGFGKQTIKQPPQYPKFNLSIPISDKPFFPQQSWVSLLRLRVAYGQSGNQASQTAVLNDYQGSIFNSASGGSTAITVTKLGNQALRPEKSAEWEGGVDVSLLENERISGKLTVSRKFTRDLITPFTLPDSYGFMGANANSQYYQNIGDVVSHNLEFSLDARLIDRRDVMWNLSIGMTKSSNKLVHKAATLLSYPNGSGSQYREGYPVGGYWGAPVMSYADVNHDGFLEQDEVTMGPMKFFGAPYPTSMLNYASDLALWNGALRFSATLNQVNGLVNNLCVDVLCGVYPRAAVDRTSPLAEQAAYIQALVNNAQYITASSSVRLSEASMTYTVPTRIAQRFAHAQSLSLTVSGRNLALWTNYAGQDPNVDTGGFLGERISDNGLGTPQPRSWIVRCNLGF